MKHEKMSLPLSSEQYMGFKFDLIRALDEMSGVDGSFDEYHCVPVYTLFTDGMENLIEWITGEKPTLEELDEIKKKAESHSVPFYFMDPNWGRQFTEDNIFDVALAIATDTLDKI